MPPLETHDRNQKAVYWAFSSFDGYGNPVVDDDPVELDVRWLDKQTRMQDPQGNTITVDATAVVDRDIDIGSILWLGSLDDIPGTSLVPTTGLMIAKLFDKTPDLKNRNQRRLVGMMRFNSILPTG